MPLLLPAVLAVLACSDPRASGELRRGDPAGETGSGEPDTAGAETGPGETGPGDSTDTGGSPVDGCHAAPAPADRDRTVVVSHPYASDGSQADTWAALRLTTAGEIEDLGVSFQMGRAFMGTVVFTPDAEVGLAVHDDGTLGVFFVGDDGVPEVVQPRYEGDFYATSVTVDPTGEWAMIVDGNWPENGGGVYLAPIDCEDGGLGVAERVVVAKMPAGLLLPPGAPDRAVLVATELPEIASDAADPEADTHLLAWDPHGAGIAGLAGRAAFGDDGASIAAVALTADGSTVLVGDNSLWSGVPNRVAAVAIQGDALAAPQVVSGIEDPVALLPSPHDDVVLVVSGYGDAVVVLAYDPGAAAPLALVGDPAYEGGSPELPSGGAVVPRGPLAGLALVAENQGVRRVWMQGGGVVTDLGRSTFGLGLDAITGAIGVQP